MPPPDSDTGLLRLASGDVLSHYRITDTLGAGGMGVVYRAVDIRLKRTVALKVIRHDAAEGDRRQRFIKEARATSAFNHPNIVTIHEVDAAGEVDFIIMEVVPGRSLDKRIPTGGLPIDDVVGLGQQIASALETAHAADIVHRDIKPANVLVTDTGHVKVLDFGIAKQLVLQAPDATTLADPDATRRGTVLGSLAYMSPEQAQGLAVDGRSDVFSFGVLLYEMLSGRRPFSGTTEMETVAKILAWEPPSLVAQRSDVPAALAALVASCLEKDRSRRPSSHDVYEQLAAIGRSRAASAASVSELFRRRAVVVPLAIAVAAIAGAGLWWWASGRDVRQARRRVPAILALAAQADYHGFYRDARPMVPLLPDDISLQQAWTDLTIGPVPVTSNPAGAEVFVKGYSASDDEWIAIGRTPLPEARLPVGTPRVKVSKEGFAPFDGTFNQAVLNLVLDPMGTVPDGMIRVPRNNISIEGVSSDVAAFWMDRFEVSNRQFKAFVDAGGYRTREYWKEPFIEEGGPVTWENALARFRDKTGRPGPSTWELGTFQEGQAEFPVSGLSWYEAAAFAVFAGKSLPTAFQWRTATDFAGPSGVYGDILLRSNFGTNGPAAIGTHRGIGPFGHYDMAGNVKEWCWNEARGGRMILGGGWNEPIYMYEDRDAQPPFRRLPTYGFRLVKNIDPQPASSMAFLPSRTRDYAVQKPIDDASFAIARSVYRYDSRPLNPRTERSADTPDWRRETVTFDAAYGDERVIAHVYLPKSARPPYQTIVYFPGGDASILRSSRELRLTNVDFLIRSGRALVFPVYKGTYERRVSVAGPNAQRDVTIARVKDFGRVMEYIASRADLDRDRVGYYGVSMGAYTGIMINAIEPGLKANVFLGGGLARAVVPLEVDPLNFATRIHVPTLMVNGRSDFQIPYQTSQLPLFRLLGVPPDRKRHALFEGGHMPSQIHDVMREILDWFDRFLGAVNVAAP